MFKRELMIDQFIDYIGFDFFSSEFEFLCIELWLRSAGPQSTQSYRPNLMVLTPPTLWY